MSYDLWFYASKGQALTRETWEAYAASMPMTRWADASRLLYENLNTGVYCGFDWNEPPADGEPGEGGHEAATSARPTPLAFNLNYARPSFFALETMPIVEKVCADLGLLVEDPQADDDSGPKPARVDELIATWTEGNEATSRQVVAYSAQGALTGDNAVSYLPRERGLAFWNYRRRHQDIKLQVAGRSETALVLMKHKDESEVLRLLAWQPDDEVWLLPECDVVRVVQRMSLFGAFPKDVAIVVPWAQVAASLGELPRSLGGNYSDVRVIDAEQVPEASRRLQRLGGRPFAHYERVRPDHCIELPLR